MYAPIIIFAFNRPKALRNVVCSLLQNTEARESDLYIFVDGARLHKDGELKEVELVREYVISITGFKTLHYTFSEVNKGLGASIINIRISLIIFGNFYLIIIPTYRKNTIYFLIIF